MQQLKKKQLDAYGLNLRKSQDELVIQYLPAVRAMAYRLKERLPSSVDVNDLISIATEELIKLSRRYDKEQNDSFWGYAKKRVSGSMLDYLRTLDVMSRANRKLVKQIDFQISVYFNEHGEEPDNVYLATVLEEELSKIEEARNAQEVSHVLPLHDQMTLYSDNYTQEKIEQEELLEHVQKVLSSFKQRDQLIIQLYYFEELSLKEISAILEISESRISQINKKLIRKIRDTLEQQNG